MSRMDSGVALRHAPHTGSYSTEPYPVHALWRADLPPPRCGFDVREDDETVNRLRANRAQISTAQTWRRARERTLREPPGRVS